MIKKRYYVKLQDLCFYIFWSALMISKGFAFKSFDQQAQTVVVLVAPFAVLKILMSHWNQQELIRSVGLCCLGIMIWLSSGKTDSLVMIISIVACKDVDIYKLFKLSFWIRGAFLVFKVLSALLGITGMQQVLNTRGVEDKRYAFGYGHPNAAHYELFVIVALAIIVWHERMKIAHYIFLCAGNLFLYYYTRSRTGMIVVFIVLLMAYEVSKKKIGLFKRIIATYGKYAYLISAAMSILICLILEWLPFFRLHGTFSSRFIDGQEALYNIPLSLFGKSISGILDMGLIDMLIERGVIFFALFLYGMTLLLKLFSKHEMYAEEAVGVTYAIYSLMENAVNTVMMNVMPLFLVLVLYPTGKCHADFLDRRTPL